MFDQVQVPSCWADDFSVHVSPLFLGAGPVGVNASVRFEVRFLTVYQLRHSRPPGSPVQNHTGAKGRRSSSRIQITLGRRPTVPLGDDGESHQDIRVGESRVGQDILMIHLLLLVVSSLFPYSSNARTYVRSFLAPFVAMPFVPSSFLLLRVMPGATTSSDAPCS